MQSTSSSNTVPFPFINGSFERSTVHPNKPLVEGEHSLWSSSEQAQQASPSLAKKKFKILNELERKGIRQKRKELQGRIQKKYDPKLENSLLKAKLQELESCYQVIRDKLEEDQECVRKKEDQIQQKDSHISLLEEELHLLKTQKSERDRQYVDLKVELRTKKRKFDELEEQNAEYLKTIEEHGKKYDDSLKIISETKTKYCQLEIQSQKELDLIKGKVAVLDESLKSEQGLRRSLQIQLENALEELQQKETTSTQLTRLNEAKESLLEEEKKFVGKLQLEIKKLRQQIELLQQNVDGKDAEIVAINKTLTEQNQCLLQIKLSIEQVNSIIQSS